MLIALVPTPHDPALTARTFIQNPRLTAALERIKAQKTQSPASVISGIETDGSDAGDPTHDDERPTERELNEIYLLVNGWQPRGAQCTYWYDPLSDVVYPFAYAMGIQDARDYVDSLAVEGDR